jgi:dihydroorotase-like cyclic amidohydrolase
VDLDKFASFSRNCPYHGWELPARAVVTIVEGQVKFRL